jgi:hypothetical protein
MKTAATLPYLWVTNFIAAQCLNELFSGIFSPEVPPTEIPQGHHILALDPDTPEATLREIAYNLLEAGCQVTICKGSANNQPLEWWLAEVPFNEAALMLITNDIPYSEWEESRSDVELSLSEATQLAQLVLVKIRDCLKANIALEELRRRAKVSEYNWDKKYLAEIRARLEKVLAASSPQLDPLTDTKERLRLDVKALLKETDPIDREVMTADIQSRYRLNSKALERIITHVSQLTKEAEVEDLGLDELFDLPCDNIEYVIPGMLPVGEAALLIANPKAGKSLLAYDAAFAVATGEDTFLGERCKQGKVLIVQCDESTGTAKGRLLKRGFRREDAANVRFMHKFSITQLGALESKLETFRPTLVIIDSLRRINAGREVSENAAEFADNIYQLKEVCSQYNAALILIHHSNKNSDAIGVEKVRGSSAIAGATWGIWELTQIPKPDPNNKKKLIVDPKDPNRILSIIARDVEGQRLAIELDPENNHWINRGEQGANQKEIQEQKTHSAKVIELLKSVAPVGLEAGEVNEQLGIGRGIYSILNRLLGQKIIGSRPSSRDRRRTVYFCSTGTHPTPDRAENPPPPTDTDPNAIEYSELVTTSTIESSIALDRKSIAFDRTPSIDDDEKQPSNVELESNTQYSITSSHYEGGRESGSAAIDSQLSQPLEAMTSIQDGEKPERAIKEPQSHTEPKFKAHVGLKWSEPLSPEPDYSTFPHRASDNLQAKIRLANRIKEQLLAATDKENLAAVKQEHGGNQVNWVWKRLLTFSEREKVTATAQTEQLNLLEQRSESPQTADPWLEETNLRGMAHDLDNCLNREALEAFLMFCPPYVLEEASRFVSAEKHAQQIKQWLLELNPLAAGD